MITYIRNIVVVIAAAAVFGLVAAKPFMPPGWLPWEEALALLFVGATWLLIMIVNKFFCGAYLPGPGTTPPQRYAFHKAVRKGQPLAFLSVLCFASAGVLMVFLKKELGWSINSALAAGLIVSVILVPVFNRFRALRH